MKHRFNIRIKRTDSRAWTTWASTTDQNKAKTLLRSAQRKVRRQPGLDAAHLTVTSV